MAIQHKPGSNGIHGPALNFRDFVTGRACSPAVTDDGRSFLSRFPEYVTANHAEQFIVALYNEFEEDLIIVLDGASYFRASTVQGLAERDDLEFVRLPAYRPDLHPVEECWRQLESALGNRYFESVNELTTTIDTALDQLSLPKVSSYF